jgi:two-component system OmpR family response regulator
MLQRCNVPDTVRTQLTRMLQTAAIVDLQTRLLLVDDDPGIRELAAAFLTGHGYLVDTAGNGEEMRAAMAARDYALIVLDVMMPGEDGLSILRSLDPAAAPPVIIVSVMGTDIDKVVGLEMGADDYLAKPANPRELLARIRSVLRRNAPGGDPRPRDSRTLYRFAGWKLDPVARELADPDGVLINLSDGEFRLLLALVERPRRVLTRDQLLDLSRGLNAEHFDRAIDVQVSRLRRKLARAGAEDLIRTVRNEGYLFSADVDRR